MKMTGMKVTSASVSGSRLILAMLRLVSTHRSVTKCDTGLRPYVTSFSGTSSAVMAVTKPPGGCPGLRAGEESGAPRSGTGKQIRPYGAAPAVFRSHVRSCNGENGLQVQGLPRPGAAGGAEPHVRLRPGRVEPHPGRPPGPLAPAGQDHVVRGVRPGADRDEEGPGPCVPQRGLLGAVAAGAAAPAQGL